MDIDASVPPPREYSDYPNDSQHSSDLDYLMGLRRETSPSSGTVAQIDERNVIDRFVSIIDQLDTRVEKLRKDALGLQEKRDFLLMSVDLIKNHEHLNNMQESDREEIICYIHRVNSRLGTVELNVKTVRDQSQEDSLSQINTLIDSLITVGDPVLARQKCQTYINACSTNDHFNSGDGCGSGFGASTSSEDLILECDKKFESALLGCTLDDQKTIKKRLNALMNYLNKQTIHNG
ncbi:BAG family molecular chaperone regulator 2 isoform X2 [Condylostylus longicornis]|uniref:BAG family molecular chaperone regulator 2 isoform X2 n=1 Tax=Condylostylus longicornis TaxID=2530218 RepID=UPI00244E33F9|nr:BAG family molecular chaperone regulator 2 isoform X2 [Condylostylus longicornis]